jgi:hypothetical protein
MKLDDETGRLPSIENTLERLKTWTSADPSHEDVE